MAVYKKEAFAAFIKAIENGEVAYWQQIAEALGVDADTITAWKELPEAQEAIQKGISNALRQMEISGKKDWRMWESKLKMLGVNPPAKHDVNVRDFRKDVLDKYLNGSDEEESSGN